MAEQCPKCKGDLEEIGSVRWSLPKATQAGRLYACPVCRISVERITQYFDYAKARKPEELEALRDEEQAMMRAAKAAWVEAHPKAAVPS